MRQRPFFCYYGGKWRAAPHYPKPEHDVIVEPFAGAAGYSTRYFDRQVLLFDVDPVIVGVWSYLIKASTAEIMALPDVDERGVDALPSTVPQEAKWLIGFSLNKGTAKPCKVPSSWMREGKAPASWWGPQLREKLAKQAEGIRHWVVEQRSYLELPLAPATWFVDPPYQGKAGRIYRHSEIDYENLAAWCRSLPGQPIVCEAEGATWLPFRTFRTIKASLSKRGGKQSHEVIWP